MVPLTRVVSETKESMTLRHRRPFRKHNPEVAMGESSEHEFVQKARTEGSDLLDNINVGNLAGTLWYLQNEVLSLATGRDRW